MTYSEPGINFLLLLGFHRVVEIPAGARKISATDISAVSTAVFGRSTLLILNIDGVYFIHLSNLISVYKILRTTLVLCEQS